MLVGAISQEKAIVGAFSVIMKTDGSFAALMLGAERILRWWKEEESGRVVEVAHNDCEGPGADS